MTSFPRKWGINSNPTWPAAGVNVLVVPKIDTPPGVSFGTRPYDWVVAAGLRPFGNASPLTLIIGDVPQQKFISMFEKGGSGFLLPNWNTRTVNLLVTFRDGVTDPIEMLGMCTDQRTDNTLVQNQVPKVTIDTATVKTPGSPSLQSHLQTFGAATHLNNFFRKAVKVPVTSGITRTVTGWVTSDASIADGDIRVRVTLNDVVLASQIITSAAGAFNWQQFTLTFVAPYTGEANFIWEHRFFAGGQTFWLADLTIT
jgi:hypothetical protein